MNMLVYEIRDYRTPPCAIDCPNHVNVAMHCFPNVFMCSGCNGYLRMLGIEVFMPKTRILKVWIDECLLKRALLAQASYWQKQTKLHAWSTLGSSLKRAAPTLHAWLLA
jgi:hypothetical protein